jgi:hypothetical protein
VLWIRIRIGSGFNGVPGSGSRRAKMTQKKRKQIINFIFLRAGCSLLRVEGFSCSLNVQKHVDPPDPDPHDPDPNVFRPSGSGSFYHQAKIVKKTLIPSVL